jgi:membrane associated rhomboid family serine protease
MPAWIVLGGWIAVQIFSQVGTVGNQAGGGVAYLAHIGGFIAGVALVFLLAIGKRRDGEEEYGRRRGV